MRITECHGICRISNSSETFFANSNASTYLFVVLSFTITSLLLAVISNPEMSAAAAVWSTLDARIVRYCDLAGIEGSYITTRNADLVVELLVTTVVCIAFKSFIPLKFPESPCRPHPTTLLSGPLRSYHPTRSTVLSRPSLFSFQKGG